MFGKLKSKIKTFDYVLIFAILIGALAPTNVSAYSSWVDNPSLNQFTFSYRNAQGADVNNQSYGTVTPGFTVLSAGVNKLFYVAVWRVNYPSNWEYGVNPTIYHHFTMEFGSENDQVPGTYQVVLTDGAIREGTCVQKVSNPSSSVKRVQYQCSATLSDNERPSYAAVQFGSALKDMNGLYLYPISARSVPVSMTYAGIGFDKANSQSVDISPLVNQNNQIINQNQTIINQNQQQINAENQSTANISGQSPDAVTPSSDATTESLLAVLANFVGAVAAISPTDCLLPMNAIKVDFGTWNMCTYSPPSAFTTLFTIISGMFFAGYALVVVRKILSLIKEFQE